MYYFRMGYMLLNSTKMKQSQVDSRRTHFGQINLDIVLHCIVDSFQFLEHTDYTQSLPAPPA
jgi:hypothetical protein